jgi:hypothetical protein
MVAEMEHSIYWIGISRCRPLRLPVGRLRARLGGWPKVSQSLSGEDMAADYRSEMEARVIERALKDESFHRQLVADPRTALQQVLGVSLPGTVSIEVLEETPSTMYLVLPPAESGSRELSEDELGAVAGGGITWSSASNQCSC